MKRLCSSVKDERCSSRVGHRDLTLLCLRYSQKTWSAWMALEISERISIVMNIEALGHVVWSVYAYVWIGSMDAVYAIFLCTVVLCFHALCKYILQKLVCPTEACSNLQTHLHFCSFQALYWLLAPHTSPFLSKHCPLHSLLGASTYRDGSTAMPALGPFAGIFSPLLLSNSGTSTCSPV